VSPEKTRIAVAWSPASAAAFTSRILLIADYSRSSVTGSEVNAGIGLEQISLTSVVGVAGELVAPGSPLSGPHPHAERDREQEGDEREKTGPESRRFRTGRGRVQLKS
jgi:hypothetical protein